MPRFNNVELTPASILKTREFFILNAQACIDEVKRGEVRVNDPAEYFKWRNEQIAASALGENDHTFTFLQRAYYVQTGEMVALLPNW